MLDVRRMRVLLAVAEHGGVAAAARALAFTPPAVSQQLAALERQVGVPLIDRGGRTAVLTPAGRRLAEHAQAVLAALESAEAEVRSMARPGGSPAGELAVATIPSLGRTLLPAVLEHLAGTAPDLRFRVEQLEPEQSLPALVRRELDLVLASEFTLTPRRIPTAVLRRDLFTEPVHVAVPSGHTAAGPVVRLADLRDDSWISPDTGSSCEVLLQRSCAIAGFEPHVVAHCDDFSVAAALVAAGLGIALIPASAARDAAATRSVRLLTAADPPIYRTLYAATRAGAERHPSLVAVLTALEWHAHQPDR